jgi:hypothetical protein
MVNTKPQRTVREIESKQASDNRFSQGYAYMAFRDLSLADTVAILIILSLD